MNLFPGREKGSVVSLFILFLPTALIVLGLVLDIGAFMGARQIAKAACDLGSLAGLQEIDWSKLEEGELALVEKKAIEKSLLYARENVLGTLAENTSFSAKVSSENGEPSITLRGQGVKKAIFLSMLPGFKGGIPYEVTSKASVVLRTVW